MSNIDNKKRVNVLKGIITLLGFIIFGYFSYQYEKSQRQLEISLDRNASSTQRDFADKSHQPKGLSAEKENTFFKDVGKDKYNISSSNENEIDVFNEHLEGYLSDPEDEITYPPEIYDTQIDDDEKELIETEIDY